VLLTFDRLKVAVDDGRSDRPTLTPLFRTSRCLLAKDGGKNVKSGKDGKEKNVIPVATAEYGCNNWRWWMNNTTISLGLNNVFDNAPPAVGAAFENNYDESLADVRGRFWYVQIRKRF
jgi:hypothetical protein